MSIVPNSIPMSQPNAPLLPPTRVPMRYANQRRHRLGPVGGVLGGNGYPNIGGNGYPNIGGNGYSNIGGNGYSNIGGNGYSNMEDNGYPNIGGNGYPNIGSNGYPNIRGNGYYPYNPNNPNLGRPNAYSYPINYRPRTFRRNIFYNRNYLPQRPYYDGLMAMPQGRFYQQTGQMRRDNLYRSRRRSSRRRSRSDQRPSPSRQRQRRRPRQLRLNDFMPPQLRDPSSASSNLPSEFTLGEETAAATTTAATTTSTITVDPPEALPQRERFVNRAANVTQPFIVNQNAPQQQQQGTTTSSFRRRQRRTRQQQYRQTENNNNRFAVLSDIDDNQDDIVEDENNNDDVREPAFKKNKPKNKRPTKKKKVYLESLRMIRWFEDNCRNSKNSISGRGNQAYLLATAPAYDQWIRDNYEMQVWQSYLKMGTEQKHWAKEVVQRTKKRDDAVNSRFVQKKINHLLDNIAQASATISDLQIQLGTYWSQLTTETSAQKQAQATAEIASNMIIERTGLSSTTTVTSARPNTSPNTDRTTTTTTKAPSRDPVDRIERYILEYIYHYTQHVRKRAQSRIELAKAQLSEFKAFEDFEQIATPSQWAIHILLQSKMKRWSRKKRNYETMLKRVEYDIPPKFITNVNFNFKIDESIITPEEAQSMYNKMSKLTKDFRTQATTVYVQSLGREYELLTDEIKRTVDCFPQDNDDGFDAEPGYAAFKSYHELRQKRINLEIEKSLYFLDEQRVEGDANQAELTVAPTLIRLLGEDFSLQQ